MKQATTSQSPSHSGTHTTRSILSGNRFQISDINNKEEGMTVAVSERPRGVLKKSSSSTSVSFSENVTTLPSPPSDGHLSTLSRGSSRLRRLSAALALTLKRRTSFRWSSMQPHSWQVQIILSFFFIVASTWAILYIIFDEEATPGGSLFTIALLELLAIIFGHVFEFFRLPPLLGMISAGFLMGNLRIQNEPLFTIERRISYPLRMVSVSIVLTRGALSVDPTSIGKYKRIIPQLVIGSCFIEATTASLLIYSLIGFPLEWAFLIGCIMSAMSGVGLLPYLKAYENQGIKDNRVIKIARTACGLDAMLAISMADICLGFCFSADIENGIKRGLVELVIGGAFGFLWGGLTGQMIGKDKSMFTRTLAVFSGGVIALLGLAKVGYPRGGALGCFMNAFISSCVWRRGHLESDLEKHEQLKKSFDKIWYLSQPLLFSLVGFWTNFRIVDWDSFIVIGLACLGISLTIRLISVYLMISFGGLTFHEKLFLTFAWTNKCTVQATVGPIAHDTFVNSKLTEGVLTDLATKVMELSVLTIVVTTCLGSFLSLSVQRKLLKKI